MFSGDMQDRNLQMLERRRSGDSFADIGRSFGISSVRVRQIIEREEARLKRAEELRQAAELPQQPNVLHLPPGLRRKLARVCGKTDFTPEDVVALGYTPAMFSIRLEVLSSRDWRALCLWVEDAGLSILPPSR